MKGVEPENVRFLNIWHISGPTDNNPVVAGPRATPFQSVRRQFPKAALRFQERECCYRVDCGPIALRQFHNPGSLAAPP